MWLYQENDKSYNELKIGRISLFYYSTICTWNSLNMGMRVVFMDRAMYVR